MSEHAQMQIVIERMVRAGYSEAAVDKAVRKARRQTDVQRGWAARVRALRGGEVTGGFAA